MTTKDTWVVWDSKASAIISIHPFRDLADRYKTKQEEVDGENETTVYMVCTLDSALRWVSNDAEKKGRDTAFTNYDY